VSIVTADESDYPAVHPQHERRKFLKLDRMAKFAGFGARVRAAFERARALHDARFSAQPLELSNGFLVSEFVPGKQAYPRDAILRVDPGNRRIARARSSRDAGEAAGTVVRADPNGQYEHWRSARGRLGDEGGGRGKPDVLAGWPHAAA